MTKKNYKKVKTNAGLTQAQNKPFDPEAAIAAPIPEPRSSFKKTFLGVSSIIVLIVIVVLAGVYGKGGNNDGGADDVPLEESTQPPTVEAPTEAPAPPEEAEIDASSYKDSERVRSEVSEASAFPATPDVAFMPRFRTEAPRLGEFEIAMATALYRASNTEPGDVRSTFYGVDPLERATNRTRRVVFDAIEQGSGSRITFRDATNASMAPQYRLFDAHIDSAFTVASADELIAEFAAAYDIDPETSPNRVGLFSRTAKRGNGPGMRTPSANLLEIANPAALGVAKSAFAKFLGLNKGAHAVGRYQTMNAQESDTEADFRYKYEGFTIDGNYGSLIAPRKATSRPGVEAVITGTCSEKHFLGFVSDSDVPMVEFGQTYRLRFNGNNGLEPANNSVASVVWKNPYGGYHWFCYQFHGQRTRSKKNGLIEGFRDHRAAIMMETTGEQRHDSFHVQDFMAFGKLKHKNVGTTGLRLEIVDEKRPEWVDIKFTFDRTRFDMPKPLLNVWRRTTPGSSATHVWVQFEHKADGGNWLTTPYIIPNQHIRLLCANGQTYYARDAALTEEETKELFWRRDAGVMMFPKRCGRKRSSCGRKNGTSARALQRKYRIDISPALTEDIQCKLLVDEKGALYKDLTIQA